VIGGRLAGRPAGRPRPRVIAVPNGTAPRRAAPDGLTRATRQVAALSVAIVTACCAGCADCCGGCGDAGPVSVTFSGGSLNAKPAVLYNGFRVKDCVRDVVCVGSSREVALGDARWQDPNAVCESEELVAFAPYASPFRTTSAEVGRVGTGGDPEDFSVELKPLVVVPLVLWYFAGYSPEDDAAHRDEVVRDVERANRWFDELGAGVLLTYNPDRDVRPVYPNRPANPPDLSNPPARTDAAYPAYAMTLGCDAPGIDGSRDAEVRRVPHVEGVPPVYRPPGTGNRPDTLNVYYPEFLTSRARGEYCYPLPPQQDLYTAKMRNVVFVSFELKMESTLAHEIGHALGLIIPWRLSGHVDDMNLRVPFPGYRGNLMDGGAEDITTITLGQIYRMHFDRLSWLNIGFPASVRPPSLRDCGVDVYEHSPCPSLTIRAPRWP
jgi:hypothetical protein